MKMCQTRVVIAWTLWLSLGLYLQMGCTADGDESELWRQTAIGYPKEITSRGEPSQEEEAAFSLIAETICSPEQSFSSGKGRLLTLDSASRAKVFSQLQSRIGARLLPDDSVRYLGAYERRLYPFERKLTVEEDRQNPANVQRVQLSYKQGASRVAVMAQLVENSLSNIVVVVAREDRKPDITALVAPEFRGKEVPSIDIIDVDGQKRTRLKVSIMRESQ